MMDTTSNELLRRKSVLGTSSDGATTFSSACAENVHSLGLACAESVGEKRKRSEYGGSCNTGSRSVVHKNRRGSSDNGDAGWGEESAQAKSSEFVGPKFNDFGKLREVVNFAVGQTWALYDTADGMPRLYAQIRKVSAPSFGVRITYLEPDPDDEKEIQWFEEDLPVSVGKFRLGKNQNTNDRSIFSHVIRCNEVSNSAHFTVSPRKGETWALFKNWDINWSSQPDSHRKSEHEVVEILSDYADGAGLSVVFLHKAKGFASVFFRMGTNNADISQILPHSLYRFSHRIPSFKLTGIEGHGIPKDAYELEQAVLPETIKEITVPSHLLAVPTAVLPETIKEITVPSHLLAVPTALKSQPEEALCFRHGGKVFQTGQMWSYYSYYWNFALCYCRIQKITFTQTFGQAAVFKLHVNRLKATPFPEDVIQYKDKSMPVGCGTFFVMKGIDVIDPDVVSHQIVPPTSMDGNKYTILPKIGDVWAIYTYWSDNIDFEALRKWWDYDIVEVLDDALGYKVLALAPALFVDANEEKKSFLRAAERRQHDWLFVDANEEKKSFLRAAERRQHDWENESELIFTIPKAKMLRFSHQIPVSRVTKEIDGDLEELFEVLDPKALPSML